MHIICSGEFHCGTLVHAYNIIQLVLLPSSSPYTLTFSSSLPPWPPSFILLVSLLLSGCPFFFLQIYVLLCYIHISTLSLPILNRSNLERRNVFFHLWFGKKFRALVWLHTQFWFTHSPPSLTPNIRKESPGFYHRKENVSIHIQLWKIKYNDKGIRIFCIDDCFLFWSPLYIHFLADPNINTEK